MPNQLDWQFESSATSVENAEYIVTDERAWAVVLININVSSSIDLALSTGNPSYNPERVATLYYASARNQITANSHVVPSILATINPLLSHLGSNHTATFLHSVSANQTQLDTALKCPQCLVSPYAMASVDLIPFDIPAASGSTMVGLIFVFPLSPLSCKGKGTRFANARDQLLTFTFSIFQILRIAGLAIGAQLRARSAMVSRTLWSLGAYFVMALSYTLINLVFGVRMDRRFGRGGFVVYWLLNTCTMGAVGLPMESLFTIIGLKWAGYFLSFWIIVNVSTAFTSFELMPGFYKYGYAFPFYHSIQGARTIIFGTKNHLGMNFGVLIAWMVMGLLGMYVGMAVVIRRNKKAAVHNLP